MFFPLGLVLRFLYYRGRVFLEALEEETAASRDDWRNKHLLRYVCATPPGANRSDVGVLARESGVGGST